MLMLVWAPIVPIAALGFLLGLERFKRALDVRSGPVSRLRVDEPGSVTTTASAAISV